MRKIILDLAVSLDGFIEGPNGETDWCIMDEDMNFDKFLDSIDTIFYGRVSYEQWGEFQPAADASTAEIKLWSAVHSKRKYVFSRSRTFDNNKITVINGDFENKVKEIKKEAGGNIWLYGGAKLINAFVVSGLIDEYRLSVHPVALGQGKPLFEGLKNRINLRLKETRTYRSGVTLLSYEPER